MPNIHYPSEEKIQKAREAAREEVIGTMLEWYEATSIIALVPELAVAVKPHGRVERWLEPLLSDVDNPLMIEEYQGDHWTIRLVPIRKKIQVLT